MNISDAELSAMYGRGLHPDTAVRVFDELRRVKAKLNDSRAINDELLIRVERAEAQEGHWHRAFDQALDERDALRVRLVETEALAERWNAEAVEFAERLAEVEADGRPSGAEYLRVVNDKIVAEARLAEVLALHYARGRNIHGDEVCNECSPLRPMPCPTGRVAAGDDRG